jgi:putative membrane protein
MKIRRLLKQFNWRFLLVRIVVNAIALAVTAAITPKIYFVDKSIGNWLLMAVMLGVLNALLKPILQFLTLQFLFVTYGLVIVFVNALILLLLSFLFPNRFAVDNLLWALVGGLVLGLLSSFLESLLGLTTPIVPDEPPELRHQLEEQARHVDWLADARSEAVPEERTLTTEPPVPEAKTAEAAVAEAAVAEPAATEPAAVEPSPPGPDEGPSPPAEEEAEPFDSVVAPPAEAVIVVEPEPAPEPREEQEEDRS